MADLYHMWGTDIQFSAGGDMLMTGGSEEGRQRVLRRLLTSQGQYLWDLGYGAGLPRLIGRAPTVQTVQAVTLSQMLLEAVVAHDPPPVVVVTPLQGTNQGYSDDISYVDVGTGDPVFLGFDVNGGS